MEFTFENNHVEDCGVPPVYNTKNYNVKLWENKNGEQILCVREKTTRNFWFHHGDADWSNVWTVDNAPPLHKEEMAFISDCYWSL